jgi:hypothetical protein
MHFADVGEGMWAAPAAFATGVAAVHQRDFAAATTSFEGFAEAWPQSPFRPNALASLVALEQGPKHRSPVLAGTMSTLIAGSGQLYAGQSGDALMAFFVPGFLGVWTYTLLRHGLRNDIGWEVVSGGVLAGGTMFTWTSNVIGAVRGARRMNGHLARKHADAVLREATHPDLERDPGSVQLP